MSEKANTSVVVPTIDSDQLKIDSTTAEVLIETEKEAGIRLKVLEFLKDGKADDALELLEERPSPNSLWYHLAMSECYLQREDFPMAIGAADSAIEINPQEAESYYQRAQARAGIEEYSEALADIERFLNLSKDPEDHRHAQAHKEIWLSIYAK